MDYSTFIERKLHTGADHRFEPTWMPETLFPFQRALVEWATRKGRDAEDEKHLCPLQLDTIERLCVLYSNPGEVVLTPFMGVGSEVYGAVLNGRRGVGIELKPAYYRQAVKNLAQVETATDDGADLFNGPQDEAPENEIYAGV